MAGAVTGAAIGSAIPVVGTVAGAVVGGVVGFIWGSSSAQTNPGMAGDMKAVAKLPKDD
jgi:hypothetical protein